MESENLSKSVVIKRLSEGLLQLQRKEGNGSRSGCWEQFKMVVDPRTNAYVGFVQCIRCNSVLCYKSSTSGMNRHKCQSIATVAGHPTPVSREDKDKVRDLCVKLCCKDLRPFSVVAGEGFLELAQDLIRVGSKYGAIPATDIIPHPSTVSRHLKETSDSLRKKLIPKLKRSVNEGECAMTTDMWTDNYRRVHYISVTGSFIQEVDCKWILENHVLATAKFPDVGKTAENIQTELEQLMSGFDISAAELKKVVFVTDRGTNIVKALQNHKRITCTIHCINTALRHTFDEEKFLRSEVPEVQRTLQAARKIVGYMKRSGLVARLERTLNQDIDTRWNSLYMLLESLHSQLEQIEDLLTAKGKGELIKEYDRDVGAELICFLKPFKDATNDLEGDEAPTLPSVVPWTFDLQEHMKIQATDSTSMQKVKKRAEKYFKEKVIEHLDALHYIATFLNPEWKSLRCLEPEKRSEVYASTRKAYDSMTASQIMVSNGDTAEENFSPPPKKRFSQWREVRTETSDVDEITNYININLKVEDDVPILNWWSQNEKMFPKLSKIARRVLCIPASSAASERCFSRAGLVVTDRRSTIDPDHVNDILFINNNIRKKNK